MTTIVPLNSEAHRHLRIDATVSARLGDGAHFVPVVIDEFPQLATHYPILLSKDSGTGAFYVGGLLGFEAGENLFLEEMGQSAAYRPLHLRRSPFFAAGDELAIDLDSPRVGKLDGHLLFDMAGAPTGYLKSIMAAFCELESGVERTNRFVAELLSKKLVEAVTLDITFDDGTRRTTDGLYTINQAPLQALPNSEVIELFRGGSLHLISLMIGSLNQISILAGRKNLRLKGN